MGYLYMINVKAFYKYQLNCLIVLNYFPQKFLHWLMEMPMDDRRDRNLTTTEIFVRRSNCSRLVYLGYTL